MAHGQGGEARWVMWIGLRQWEGLPGEFDVGQTGWVYARGNSAGFFFVPARGLPCRTRCHVWPTTSCASPCSRTPEAAAKDA